MTVPTWARSKLSEQDVISLQQTIRNIESQAHGEVVVVIMKKCIHDQLAVYLWWMISILLALLVFFLHQPTVLYVIPFLLVLFSITRDEFNRFWMSSADLSIKKNALLAYYQSGLDKIESQSGVLIFLSLYERQVEVLAGPSIVNAVQIESIQQVIQAAIPYFKKNQIYQGLAVALKDCEKFLLEHFKRADNKKNEFHSEIIFLDK